MPVEADEAEPLTLRPVECPFGHENESSARFCHECGTPLRMKDAEKTPTATGQEVAAFFEAHPDEARALVEALARQFLKRQEVEEGQAEG